MQSICVCEGFVLFQLEAQQEAACEKYEKITELGKSGQQDIYCLCDD